jgi:hypothetical protein
VAASGKNLSYKWSATAGRFKDPKDSTHFIETANTAAAVYKAPDKAQDVTVTVIVTGDGGQQVTKNLIFKVVDTTPITETPIPALTSTFPVAPILTLTPTFIPTPLPISFQNFEADNGSCIGAGCYFWDAFYMMCSFESVNVHEGTRAARCEAHAHKEDPKENGGSLGVNPSTDHKPIDLSQATTISAWIYDAIGGNNAQLRIRYYDNKNKEIITEGVYSSSTNPTIKDTWTEISWELSEFGNIDSSHVKNIEIYVYNDGIYYFDFVSYK